MRSSDNKAFKEWAVVCRALGTGRQIIILRKGGIAEGPRGFEVIDRQFFLYPTYLHQSPTSVAPSWRDAFDHCVDPAPGSVTIQHYAIVASWVRVRTMEKLKALRSQHILSDAVVEERFKRWADDGVHALMVRAYELPEPVVIPELESYAGCKSWLTLEEQVPLVGARPVLDDAEFEKRMEEVRAIFR
ncbi:MAG TPA: DUF1802 family protein [Planctomycetota bacterium]|nr:DUF1802 family protein [Planctomycetota bacterium]